MAVRGGCEKIKLRERKGDHGAAQQRVHLYDYDHALSSTFRGYLANHFPDYAARSLLKRLPL